MTGRDYRSIKPLTVLSSSKLTLLHLEQLKLYVVLVVLSAIGFIADNEGKQLLETSFIYISENFKLLK